jgi:hypothetical protein
METVLKEVFEVTVLIWMSTETGGVASVNAVTYFRIKNYGVFVAR